MTTQILNDKTRGIKFKDERDYIEVSRYGLTFKQVKQIVNYTGISIKDLANLISISTRQLARYKDNTILKSNISAHLIQILDLFKYGEGVFGDLKKFQLWINSEIRALNYLKPIDFFDTPFGIEEIKNILGRIEHGVYS